MKKIFLLLVLTSLVISSSFAQTKQSQEDHTQHTGAVFAMPGQHPMTNGHHPFVKLDVSTINHTQVAVQGIAGDTLLWSNASTWSGGSVPGSNAAVLIPAGKIVKLDVSPPALKSIDVMGTLVFDRKDINLSVGLIYVEGRFEIGTPTLPFAQKAVITLTGAETFDNDRAFSGSKFIVSTGEGVMSFHGKVYGPTWTRISATVNAGTTQLNLQDDVSAWHVGDQIVIVSTDYNAEQAEVRTITAVNGSSITLNSSLHYMHYGATETYAGRSIKMYAEVGNLTRNILIQGDEGSNATHFGGHTMAHTGGSAYMEGVEFNRMGQAGHLARYPFHWHLLGDVEGQYIRSSSIHNSFQRAVTIHGSHNANVSDNVAYEIRGHAFFFEDAVEVGVTMERNLGAVIRRPDEDEKILDTDGTPSVYWVTRAENTIRDNVAAGVTSGFGFWYDIKEHPTGPSEDASVDNRIKPMGIFDGNVSHSNGRTGTHSVEGGGAGLFVEEKYRPDLSPVFENFTTYKNENRGTWMGRRQLIRNARYADNLVGMFGLNTTYEDILIVGESNNKGTPEPGETTGLDGRTLPASAAPSWPINAVRMYDGWMRTDDAVFANFRHNDQRPSAAVGFRVPKGQNNVLNYLSNITLVNAGAAYIPDRSSYKDLNVRHDGSLTGTGIPGAIVGDHEMMLRPDAQFIEDYNGYVVNAQYANLRVTRKRAGGLPKMYIENPWGKTSEFATFDDGGEHYGAKNLIQEEMYTIDWAGDYPDVTTFSLRYALAGDWVMLEIPYANGKFTISGITAAGSFEAVRDMDAQQYYYDKVSQKIYAKIYMSNPLGIEEYDEAGQTSFTIEQKSSTINVPPAVEITSPANNAVLGSGSVNIQVAASDDDGSVSNVKFYVDGNLVGTDNNAPFAYVWNNPDGGFHSFDAVATDNKGDSGYGSDVNVQIGAVTSMPSPWISADVGDTGAEGTAGLFNGTEVSVSGAGTDIYERNDNFHFVYQPMSGNAEIVAKITAIGGSEFAAKAGIMIRASLDQNAQNVMLGLNAKNRMMFQHRNVVNGETTAKNENNVTAPLWVKLERVGSTLRAYSSSNGTSWTLYAEEAITMANTVYVGLAVTSHEHAHLFNASFDRVAVNGTQVANEDYKELTDLPNGFYLSNAWPNPFNPTANFELTIAETQPVKVEVYNVLGQRVAQLHDGVLPAGSVQTFTFNAAEMPSGLYFYRVIGKTFTAVKRMMLVK